MRLSRQVAVSRHNLIKASGQYKPPLGGQDEEGDDFHSEGKQAVWGFDI